MSSYPTNSCIYGLTSSSRWHDCKLSILSIYPTKAWILDGCALISSSVLLGVNTDLSSHMDTLGEGYVLHKTI